MVSKNAKSCSSEWFPAEKIIGDRKEWKWNFDYEEIKSGLFTETEWVYETISGLFKETKSGLFEGNKSGLFEGQNGVNCLKR